MNKKRLTGGVVALGLAALVAVGGSLAWFTDTESKTNSLTTGKVDITLTEEGPDGAAAEGINYENVMPGDELVKKVTITNVEEKAYVRLKVTVTGLTQAQANELTFLDENGKKVALTFDANNVAYINGTTPLETNDTFVPFAKVVVPTSWTNSMSKKSFAINVQAQAIQHKNNDAGFAAVTDDTQIVEALPNN